MLTKTILLSIRSVFMESLRGSNSMVPVIQKRPDPLQKILDKLSELKSQSKNREKSQTAKTPQSERENIAKISSIKWAF